MSQILQGMFQDHIIAETPDYKNWAVEHETDDSLKVTGLKIKLHVKEPSILFPMIICCMASASWEQVLSCRKLSFSLARNVFFFF